ncbi:HTH-type transcriptional regulatory protein GabR [bioreactor metagenome]|uniref:HTH-type transcriptional regulatory protein GabR n=1 Tax=bioreactor metagenome TaxID=1076179 RepID=A0A644YIQ4_9ZZZZ
MLVSEGFARSAPGAGVYVCEGVFNPPPSGPAATDFYQPSLSPDKLPTDIINFDSGIPALDLFPRARWNRTVSNSFLEAPVSALGYDDPQGRPELREVLAAYLKKVRGILCSPDQIVITSGAKQGLTLIAKCLLDQKSEVLLEDPSNANVAKIFSYHTNRLTPVPVDREGIRTECLPPGIAPALIFLTPSHQFPMGGVLSIGRRLELIRYARQSGCYLVEDDYDSEFRYGNVPVRSLYELDSERVIYVGTFSKVMFPSLRLGYLVLPYPLLAQCVEWKRLADHHSNSVYQLALMRFLVSGELERHIARMKKVYLKRRRGLLEQLETHFPGRLSVYGEEAGMHLVAGFDDVSFSPDLIRRIREEGVYLVPVETHAIVKGAHTGEVILGYAHLTPEETERGLLTLKRCIEKTLPG